MRDPANAGFFYCLKIRLDKFNGRNNLKLLIYMSIKVVKC